MSLEEIGGAVLGTLGRFILWIFSQIIFEIARFNFGGIKWTGYVVCQQNVSLKVYSL
jgi:hypothetical protein